MHKGSIPLVPIVVTFFAIAAFLGVMYYALPSSTPVRNTNAGTTNTNVVYCTADAKLCPDGSAVGRVGPKCEFAECPKDDISPVTTNAATTNTNTTTTSAQSYGLWFPFNDGATINNPRPVIYGKVSQAETTYLSTTFTNKEWPGRDFGQASTLTYSSGAVKNLTLQLDGHIVTDVQGFPQYPNLACYRNVTDPTTGGQIPEYYDTVAECRAEFKERLPALIFVFRPTADLTPGEHVLTVGAERMTFVYKPTYTIAAQATQQVLQDKNSYYLSYEYFDRNDTCTPGYYQLSNDFPMPLPVLQSSSVFYGLSFPQSDAEKGSIKRRQVSLVLGGKQYPVFFPDSLTFYENPTGEELNLGDYGLFLPIDKMVYSDGKAARPWSFTDTTMPGQYHTSGYYTELYPVDIAGREYRGRSLPWSMAANSGCDG